MVSSNKNKRTATPRLGPSKILRELVAEQTRLRKWQARHGREDSKHFGGLAATLASQPTKADIQEIKNLLVDEKGAVKFATKEDVAGILGFWNNVKLGAKIISGGSKWGYSALLVLITLAGAWALFSGGFKAVLIYLLSLITRT